MREVSIVEGKRKPLTLTYEKDIGDGFLVSYRGSSAGDEIRAFEMKPHVVFVAIKNGMHDPSGFVYARGDLPPFRNGDHVGKVHDLIMTYFGQEAGL